MRKMSLFAYHEEAPLRVEGGLDHGGLRLHVAADLGAQRDKVLERAGDDLVEGGDAGGQILGWKEKERVSCVGRARV